MRLEQPQSAVLHLDQGQGVTVKHGVASTCWLEALAAGSHPG